MTRKLITIGIMLIMALALVACRKEAAKITQLSDLEGKVVATMSTPQGPDALQAFLEQRAGFKFKEMLHFDDFLSSIAALKSNKADAVFFLEPTLSFYASRDTDMRILYMPPISENPTTFHMVLRTADTKLREDINAAIIAMRSDGTLARLEREFITELTPAMTLAGKDMPVFDGAPMLTVGIGGNNPPVDYIAANGRPSGYNVELLALLAEILEVNIEIKVIPTASKFPALASNVIDVFFLHPMSDGAEYIAQTLAANENVTLTESYFGFTEWGYLVLK